MSVQNINTSRETNRQNQGRQLHDDAVHRLKADYIARQLLFHCSRDFLAVAITFVFVFGRLAVEFLDASHG